MYAIVCANGASFRTASLEDALRAAENLDSSRFYDDCGPHTVIETDDNDE